MVLLDVAFWKSGIMRNRVTVKSGAKWKQTRDAEDEAGLNQPQVHNLKHFFFFSLTHRVAAMRFSSQVSIRSYDGTDEQLIEVAIIVFIKVCFRDDVAKESKTRCLFWCGNAAYRECVSRVRRAAREQTRRTSNTVSPSVAVGGNRSQPQ